MLRENLGTGMLRLVINQLAGEHIRAWQQQLNLELIRRQLAQNKRAVVIRFRNSHRLQAITEEPALGEAEPWYGEIGGLYSYTFIPRLNDCDLVVEMTDRGAITAETFSKPLSLVVRQAATIDQVYEVEQQQHTLWLRPDIWEEGTSLHEVSGGELCFWIDGEIYKRLISFGWSRQQIHVYRYQFTPLTVGCDIVVNHITSGHMFHLTRHIDW